MAHFEEVLGRVRLALTWASPAEMQAMLDGLVEEQIISEAYGKSLSLHRLMGGVAPETVRSEPKRKAGSDELEGVIHSQVSTSHWRQDQHRQVKEYRLSKSRESAIADHNQTRSEDEHNSTNIHPLYDSVSYGHNPKLIQELSQGMLSREPAMSIHYLNHRITCNLRLDEDTAELPRDAYSMQKLVSENERVDERISESEKLWLEQYEEAARQLAMPLWQHWDRGQKVLLPLIHPVTASFSASENGASECGEPCPVLYMEEETELAVACQTPDLYTDNYNCMEVEITDTSLTLDTVGGLHYMPGYDSLATTGLNTNHFNISEATDTALNASPVVDFAADDYENEEDKERVASHSDVSDFINDDELLRKLVDTADILFGDPLWNCEDVLNNNDVSTTTELPSPDSDQPGQQHNFTGKTTNRNKRLRAPQSRQRTDDNTPSRAKRKRAAGKKKPQEAQTQPTITQGSDPGAEPSPAEMADLTTTPPKILHFHPSIQFITIPETPRYQVVQTLSLSPPVIRLPLPNAAATPTYIFDIQISPCKESQVPQSPTVLDIPQGVKDYIQEAKAHMSQTCQEMEAGLSLTSHYVDVKVIRKEILRSGKNTVPKCLDKELVIMGETDRQKSLLGKAQIFENSPGDKPKHYILLLGNAGMGKTTLIRKLCFDWSKDCIPQFDFVFLLDAKALTVTEPTYSLQTLLLNLSSFAPSCIDPEAVYAHMLAAPKRVLIIFDGFDELRDYEILLQTQEKDLITSLQKDSKAQTYTVRQLYSALLQRVLLPGCTLLLSARPRGTASQLLRRADSLLEMCGFSPTYVETYFSQYFTDPDLRASAMDCLTNCSYLHLLCWNPGLCRLVCLVLEQSKNLETPPRTLTGLCHQVLHLKMERDCRSTHSQAETQERISIQSAEETGTHISGSTQVKRGSKDTLRKSRAQVITRSHTQRPRRAKVPEKEAGELEADKRKSVGSKVDSTEERVLLSQLSSLAWEGVKANSSIFPKGQTISTKVKAFGLRTGLFMSHHLRTKHVVSSAERESGREDREKTGSGEKEKSRGKPESTDMENNDVSDAILLWANPFLQSYLAGLHLSLSRTVSDRTFLQTLPFHSGPKGRRRPQREELELTQRFAVGLLFHNRTELQRLHLCTETTFRNMLASKQSLVTKHLEGLSPVNLTPAQVLEACHYVYEASFTHGGNSRDSGGTRLAVHLAAHLPDVLTFHRVSLNPPDTFVVQNVLERGGTEGRSFCLDLVDSGVQISGLRALVGLSNINTYRYWLQSTSQTAARYQLIP
ncbi:hypothetical protein PAMA_009274 [Pampus argenteus]